MTRSKKTFRVSVWGATGKERQCSGMRVCMRAFSTVQPWLPLAANFCSENVENARRDGTSIYHLYRRLIAARRAKVAITLGSYRPIVAHSDLILYMRENAEEQILVALNLGPSPASVRFPQPLRGQVLVSSFADRDGETIEGDIDLRDHEGLVIDLVHGSPVPA